MAPTRHASDVTIVLKRARWGIVAALAAAIAGCQIADQAPTSVAHAPSVAASAAKTGGGGTGTTALTVTATSPTSAPQDTTLDVTITGTGFTTGAKATWSLNGDTTLVHVKTTRVASSTQLVATVIVPAGTPTASYDVDVTLVGGKKGVGAELFTVTLADPTVTWKLPLDDGALAFRSDHQFSDGTYSVYANGVCNVRTWVEMSASDPFPGFAHVLLNQGKCNRSMTLVYPDGQVETAQGNVVQRKLEEPSTPIPWGATVKRTLAINIGTQKARCGQLFFGEGSNGLGAGSDSVLVTRSVDGTSWHVQSDGARNLALCKNTNQLFAMPVDFTIVADDPSRFP